MSEINNEIQDLEKELDSLKNNGLYGTMVEQYICCGKEGCKCMQGYKHGPYPHIHLYDNNNILRGIYIGKKKKELYEKKLKDNLYYYSLIKKINTLYLKDREKNK